MICKELKRMIFNIPAAVIVCSALMVSLVISYVTIHNDAGLGSETLNENYREYMVQLQGELTKEKEQFLENENRFIEETLAKENEKKEQYRNNEISFEAFQEYLDDYNYASSHEVPIQKVTERYEAILRAKEATGVSAQFVYNTDWDHYLDMEICTFFQMLSVLALAVGYFFKDFSSGMAHMMRTYEKGRTHLLNIRLAATLLTCAVTSLLFSAVYYLIFTSVLFMPASIAPVQSLPGFEQFPFGLSVGGFLWFAIAFRTLALCLLGIFSLSVASLTKNITASFGVCGFVILLPMFFSVSSEAFRRISVYEVVLGVGIMKRNTEPWQIFFQLLIFAIATIFLYFAAVYQQSDFRWSLVSKKRGKRTPSV